MCVCVLLIVVFFVFCFSKEKMLGSSDVGLTSTLVKMAKLCRSRDGDEVSDYLCMAYVTYTLQF